MNDKLKKYRMRISPEREAELADLADSVVEAHCDSAKIEPEKIIAAKDIALIYDHYDQAFDGMIECEGGQFFIHCNLDRDNLPGTPRARFTLAHELGHYFIDEHRNGLLSGTVKPHPSFSDRAGIDLLVEREADFFASRILLPESRFCMAARKAPIGIAGIASLAQQFEVSFSCAAIRVATADVFPAVIVKWAEEGVVWKWCSRSFWDFGYRRITATRGNLPPDSATARALAAIGSGRQITENATTAAHWFPVAENNMRNIILKEEAITLGNFGALTLLSLHKGNFPSEVVALRDRELGFEDDS